MNIRMEIFPLPLLKRKDNVLLRCIDVVINQEELLQHQDVCLKVSDRETETEFRLGTLTKGENRKEILIPEVDREKDVNFLLSYGDHKVKAELKIKPAKKWEIFLVLHSHTDLGFTAPVSEVAQIHNDNTDLAVLYCSETAHWPEGSRFKWTCEVSWQVQNYLRDREENKVKPFIEQLQKRNIEVGALYSGELTEILGHEQAVRSFYYAAKLRREYNIPVDTAMLCDVPGCTKGFVQVMEKSGINNFIMADNNFIAPFLSRTDLPRPFYWSGDNGSKVLAWYTDHPYYAYIEGKNYGLSESYTDSRNKLPYKLLALEESGYQLDEFQLQYAFDNFRIEFRPAAIVKEWNEKWEYPKLRIATAGEFLNKVRKKYHNSIPVVKGDWSDWWSGIVTGFPKETAYSRYLHNKIPALEILSSAVMLNSEESQYPIETFKNLYYQTLAFDEHSGSGLVWEAKSSEEQRKALHEGYGFLYNSLREASELEDKKRNELSSLFRNDSDADIIAVFNPLNIPFNGLVNVQYNHQGLFFLKDQKSGSSLPVSKVNGSINFYAEEVPPFGFKCFQIAPGEFIKTPSVEVVDEDDFISVTNHSFIINISKTDGEIKSVYNRRVNKELAKDAFGSVVVYEPVPVVVIEMGKYTPEVYSGVEFPGKIMPSDSDSHTEVKVCVDEIYDQVILVNHIINNQVWLSRKTYLDGENLCLEYKVNGKLLNDSEFLKNHLTSKGMLYLHFSMNAEKSELRYEAPCSLIYPAADPFKGSCKDHSAVQNFIQIYNQETLINFVSSDAPLVDFGGIALMKYRMNFPDNLQDMYVRAMSLNEFNIKNQSPYTDNPDLLFRFVVSASLPGEDSLSEAYMIGERANNGLIPFIIPAGNNGALVTDQFNFIEVKPEHVKVMTIKKAESGSGLIVRLRETLGKKEDITVMFPGKIINQVYKTMLSEEKVEEIDFADNKISFTIDPFSIETFNIQLS
jgi:alpha-mannosidase